MHVFLEKGISHLVADVTSDEIKHDLLQAQSLGNTAIKDFFNDRLISKQTKFYEKIKLQKLKTLEAL